MNAQLEKALNERIADFAVLYFKLHRYHWFVKGPGFYSLHSLFENLYDASTALLDQFAERLLAIGGTPAATMKEYISLATLSEQGNEEDSMLIAQTLMSDYQTIVNGLKSTVSTAESADDASTADMCIATITDIEKNIWMLRQFMK